MKGSHLVLTTLLALSAAVSAGEAPEVVEPAPKNLKMGFEAEAHYGYVGEARTDLGHHRSGDITEQDGLFRLILTPQWGQGPVFRFGLGLQRYSFGLPNNAPVPNTLESVSVIVGVDFQLGDSWLMRVEAEPGLYAGSEDTDTGDFNVPFIVGGSYIASAELQYFFGLSVDVNRRYPVIPAVGLRWNFSGPWTANLVLPAPRLEYAWSKALTLYVGAEVKDGTYRMGDDFGDKHANPRLNETFVEYDEVRVGGGVSWKSSWGLSVEAEAGYLPYREFNFHRAEAGAKTENGAAYGQVGLSAKF